MTCHFAQARHWILTLPLVAAISLGGCAEDRTGVVSTHGAPVAALTGYEGCLQFDAVAEVQDCLQFHVDTGVLFIRHAQAAFNCCPGDITADIVITPGEIVIQEKEAESACRCLCLYTIDYEVSHLAPGTYTVRVVEPYATDEDEPLLCTVEVRSLAPQGCCVKRSHYPWN